LSHEAIERDVDFPDLEELAGDVCASVDLHVIRSSGLAGAEQGVLDPFGDEDVGRAASLDDRLGRPVGDHEDRGADHCPPSWRSPMRGPTVVDPGIGCKAHSGGSSPRRSAAIRAK
jgi:hypothetical protein